MKKRENLHIGLIRTNLYQCFASKGFFIAVGLVVLILLFNQLNEESAEQWNTVGLCGLFTRYFISSALSKLVVLAAALPVVTGFCNDWNTQYIRVVVGRCGTAKYARHKLGICMFGTFAAAFIGLSLFALLLLLKYPIAGESDLYLVTEPFLNAFEYSPALYLFIKIFVYSVYCMMWGVMGLTLSTYYPNRYLAFCSPFIICYLLELISDTLMPVTPQQMWLHYLGASVLPTPIYGNGWLEFFYLVLLFTAISLLVGELFIHGVKRRMRNEMV